jgi:hypothetical protein
MPSSKVSRQEKAGVLAPAGHQHITSSGLNSLGILTVEERSKT